jgi:hypothetical protein
MCHALALASEVVVLSDEKGEGFNAKERTFIVSLPRFNLEDPPYTGGCFKDSSTLLYFQNYPDS